ncbi:MAG: methylthioribulose 1-phosphate dehydratase [Leptospiraceae bacterium]|nr:methylthioribulose 1-phosphate dehydratase [Leptospiraceae bacterium]MCB1303034.1 methylthioribulose 1-phosphate dehydratase [Leptospiraceae bacterium]
MSDPKTIISEMCQNFYRLGWVSGTGGGISIRRDDRIYMAPSGVEKEKIRPEDCYVLDLEGNVQEGPANPNLKLTECAPLFLSAYELRNAGAVLHSHSANVVLMTMLARRIDEELSVLEFTQLEMIKGILGHGYYDTFELPVVDNTPRECELTESLRKAMERFPDSPAVAVRNHGIYVWGPDEVKAKTQAECIDYICEVYWKMRSAGIDSHISARPQPASV